MNRNPTAHLTVLAPEREVTVVEEEHHQSVLVTYAPAVGDAPHRVLAELVLAPVARGGHAGRAGIEVRLDGHRIGELTFRMAQRYLPVIEPMLARGERVGCRALVRHGRRGLVEVELRLPEERHAPVPVPPPDDRRGRRRAPRDGRPGTRTKVGIGLGIGALLLVGALNRGGDPASTTPPAAPVATAAALATPAPSTAPAATETIAPLTTAPSSPPSVPLADPDPDVTRAAAPVAPATRSEAPAGSTGGVAYYPNCTAAKAAGAAPLYRGDAGYSAKLDRDKDGVACE